MSVILHSNREMDTTFVAQAMKEHNLDPVPVLGFHTRPEYWMESTRWRRVVEHYEWGAVVFLTDHERNANATIVAIGKLDLDKGKVSTAGGWQALPTTWYAELQRDLSAIPRPDNGVLQIPPCLGFRQPDHVCDGGMNPELKKVEPACAWRDRCMALQAYASEVDRYQEEILSGKSPEQIVQLTTRLLERKGGKPVAAKPKPAASEQRPVRSVQGTPAPGSNASMAPIVAAVALEVATACGFKLSVDTTKATATPDDLYLVDRTARSDYISVYQHRPGKPLAIASFRIRPRMGGFVVQLPVEKSSALLKDIVDVDVKVWKDGAFQSAVKDVPTSGNRMEHIKHIMVAVIKRV